MDELSEFEFGRSLASLGQALPLFVGRRQHLELCHALDMQANLGACEYCGYPWDASQASGLWGR